MSAEFRELLKKIGSGAHTHKDLTREEAYEATEMMLRGIATPAQIGAFLIAHRIKRPTGEELAGMLDAYMDLGSKLSPLTATNQPLTILGIPYDGRSRSAPISPITALMLACCDVPVLMHGGARMPTKYGITLAEIWQYLGIDFTLLSLTQIEDLLNQTNLGFLYLPTHFPLAHSLVKYRDEIGKRPPLATLELIWQPYLGNTKLIAGYVHPPTENMVRRALELRGIKSFTMIKGLEGSGDLKLSQTTIIGVNSEDNYQYLKLNSHEFNLSHHDVSLGSDAEYYQELTKLINGEKSSLFDSAIWNGAFYLWHSALTKDLATGIDLSKSLLSSGQIREKIAQIKSFL
ncbi:MAG: anthranilate phosphoribosyltransferase family protein [Cyanobacterium sp. T60_A2020_053]|nr:anthranilate phosphoribosyltransferase family protein [Cyanobacterium sp. T60_A2020_053]